MTFRGPCIVYILIIKAKQVHYFSNLFDKALSQIVVLFYVLFVLCRSVYCLCVNVYCTTATG